MFEGQDILDIAKPHLGERYVLGCRADMSNPHFKGPWDCAEFASWCAYQAYGILFGTTSYGDPYSGAWIDQARSRDCTMSVEDAVRTPGAFLLRKPIHTGTGHVAISDGQGGTIEARGSRYGVVEAPVYAPGRIWDLGCYIPGIQYERGPEVAPSAPSGTVLKLDHPFMRGAAIESLQRALRRRQFHPGAVDGVFGPQTANAVSNFQRFKGLSVDGVVGPATAEALGLDWPIV